MNLRDLSTQKSNLLTRLEIQHPFLVLCFFDITSCGRLCLCRYVVKQTIGMFSQEFPRKERCSAFANSFWNFRSTHIQLLQSSQLFRITWQHYLRYVLLWSLFTAFQIVNMEYDPMGYPGLVGLNKCINVTWRLLPLWGQVFDFCSSGYLKGRIRIRELLVLGISKT
jgi:hypothetical protein